jgi:starch synthase
MARNPLKIVFVCSEAVPFAKTGGMADVAGSLPVALARLGHKISLIIPRYRSIDPAKFGMKKLSQDLAVPFGPLTITAPVYESAAIEGVTTYLIDYPDFFDRQFLYGTPDGDYSDNDERFAFFSRAALEVMRNLPLRPDIIHCHDWQTGLIPVYLSLGDLEWGDLRNSKVFFTVHNLAYQGNFDFAALQRVGLPPELFRTEEGLEFYGKVSYLKGGIVYSDVITTVSPTYSREIQKDGLGLGFEGILRARADSLHGIVNGIDYGEWNPETDALLPLHFREVDLLGKEETKKILLGKLKLPFESGRLVMGMISRLAEQKGLDILCEAIPRLLDLNVCFVILGFGDQHYHDLLGRLARERGDKLSVVFAFDNALAHMIYAGSDVFLMPSRYEPCGLGQLISMKYGTPPLVRSTGGLKDTVVPFDPDTRFGTGFVFEEYTVDALTREMQRAVNLFPKKDTWKKLITNCMRQDYSWGTSALQYIDLYRKAKKISLSSRATETVP